jgi:uncharacterized SAM-dependent methyltransferase
MPRLKPTLFVGSSTESAPLINGLTRNLRADANVVPWNEHNFTLSHTTLEGLEAALDEADFAAFILGPDDEVRVRGDAYSATRDNVIFELGLFMGRLGRDRAFILAPDELEGVFRVATDLLGLTVALYEASARVDAEQAMRLPAADIRAAIAKSGIRPSRAATRPPRVEGVLNRGDTRVIETVADSALYINEQRYLYIDELRRRVQSRELVPSKYQYFTPEGSRYWLELCDTGSYQYHREALDLLEKHAGTIADTLVNAAGTAALDFVSLGSGDGRKDDRLLRALGKRLQKGERAYYYPVDISDSLLVEAVRNAFGRGVRKGQFHCKPILGDFTKLEQLQPVYEFRPEPNVFSILGNTVGNSDEKDILASIGKAMLDGDFVLVEFNAGSSAASQNLIADPVAVRSDFSPLAALGIKLDMSEVTYHETDKASVVSGTHSVIIGYKSATIGRKRVRNIKLSVLHHYDFEAFVETVEERLGVQTLARFTEGTVGLILARREL